MSDQQHSTIIITADLFNQSARKLLSVDGSLHVETLIASMARMAGSLMYRSFNFEEAIEPGTGVFSDLANEHGPKLKNVMLVTLQQLGSAISDGQLDKTYASTKFSKLTFKESHDKLAPLFLAYRNTSGISFEDAAFGAAVATAILVHDCRDALPVEKGGAIAVYGFVEGTKTAPYPLPTAENPCGMLTQPTVTKPWYKLW